MAAPPFAPAHATASLLLSFRPVGRRVLILGAGRLAASRAFAALEAGAQPVVVGLDARGQAGACDEIRWRVTQGEVAWRDAPAEDGEAAWAALLDELDREESGEARESTASSSTAARRDSSASSSSSATVGTHISAPALLAVCVTDTLHLGDAALVPAASSSAPTPAQRSMARAQLLARLCRTRRIPINVADQPALCDFSFPATHRFASAAPGAPPSSLQVAVTTNGRGCRLAGRIRREIVAALPRNVGDAVERVGRMRELAKRGDRRRASMSVARSRSRSRSRTQRRSVAERDEEDGALDSQPLNSPVPQLRSRTSSSFFGAEALAVDDADLDAEEEAERNKRRMRWVAQMSEYWPIEHLGSLREEQMSQMLDTYDEGQRVEPAPPAALPASADSPRGRLSARGPGLKRDTSQHSLALMPPSPERAAGAGHIYLLGSGPGHPGLLTLLAHTLLTSPDTHLILSDKLVPAPILRLIPPTTPLIIARKFPGNAEGAQSELIALALKAAREEGKTVVRLKQGDPFVYGRGGEEVLAFRAAGIECTVVPGISSSLAAPLLLGLPVTQRGAADSLTLCTGVGRGGKLVKLPGYERARSTVILMGVARLRDVVATLTEGWAADAETSSALTCGAATSGRTGAAFPPHTPIAIVERASSSDQRLVASTLAEIVDALERSGEQRPPGMMLIGWAVLSLHGTGDVSVLDDESECLAAIAAGTHTPAQARTMLDAKDVARVERWLGPSRCIVREGLDDAYAAALARFAPATQEETHVSGTETPKTGMQTPKDGTATPTAAAPDFSLAARAAAGWAPPRYAADAPWGGWGAGERPNKPAVDEAAWRSNEEYVKQSAQNGA
jgi:uroporphyrin-III C-methyltransferase